MEKPTTSKELKQRILFLEQKRETDKQSVKAYLSPKTMGAGQVNLLQTFTQSVQLPMDFKSIAVKALVSFVTGFLVKKLSAKRVVNTDAEIADKLIENAIDAAVNRNSGKLSEQERKIFKKMLNHYLATH